MTERLIGAAGKLFPVAFRYPQVFWSTVASVLFLALSLIVPVTQLGLAFLSLGLLSLLYSALERLRISRNLWRQKIEAAAVAKFVENDAVPIFITSLQGRITFRNAAAIERFSGDGSTMVAATSGLFASPAALFFQLQSQAEADGKAEAEHITRVGRMHISVFRTGTGDIMWRFTERPDVPFEKIMGDGLVAEKPKQPHASSMRDRWLDGTPSFDQLPVPLVTVRRNGQLRRCNAPAKNLLGLDGSCRGIFLGDLVEGLGRAIPDWLKEAAHDRGVLHSEFVRATRPPSDVFIQISAVPIYGPKTDELLLVLNDATKLKTLEAQFVQSQKMQAIGQLAGGVAHDFNNLLTAISGHCDLLLLRHDKADSDYPDLIQIHRNAKRAAGLVGQLLAFSRKQTLTPERLEIAETLDDLAHLLNRLVGEKVKLKLIHGSGLCPIMADKRQLEQVIMNLVVNSRDAMPDGGEILISTRAEKLSTPLRRDRATVPAGSYLVVSVRDQGTGIQADRLQKVFEPFYTTKRTGEGTGLGLSMAYGIVKQTGGFIFVDSTPGSGTEFTLYFPIARNPAKKAEPLKLETPRATHSETGGVVLLVEDEAPVRAFASRALRMRGYTVHEAESAEEALEKLEDADLSIDVFVTDVIMPGMDGPSWVARALQDRPGVRVVFVSGYAEDRLAEQQARIPNSVFLPKPFSLSELTDTVQQHIA